MNERVFRFSFVGITFILAIMLGYWICGGSIIPFFQKNTNINSVVTFLAPLIFSPVFGFCLSTMTAGLIRLKYLYQLPDSKIKEQYDHKLLTSFPSLEGLNDFWRNNLHDIFISHQILLRTKPNNAEILKFTVRRTDFYRAQWNISFSIMAGFILGMVVFCQYNKNFVPQISCLKIFIVLILIAYLFIAFFQSITALKEVNDIEKRFIIFDGQTAQQPVKETK